MATKDFFISYSTPDRVAAREIVEILQSAGFTTFWDQDFAVGSDFVGQIHWGLTNCDRMIAVMSPGYLERPWTSAEWHSFLTPDPSGTQGLLIPIRIEDFAMYGIFASRVFLPIHARRASECVHFATPKMHALAGVLKLRSSLSQPQRCIAFSFDPCIWLCHPCERKGFLFTHGWQSQMHG